jgi:hypothetical protein
VAHVSGTCQDVYPASIVAIYRQGVLVGSAACTVSNAFQLDVTLIDGQNVLLAKIYNMNGIYGPDSSTVTISYTPPVVIAPETPPQVVTESAPSDLSIVTTTPFQAIDATHKTVQVSVLVDGGATPYTIELNWGDGSTDSKQVGVSGTYTFMHDYIKPATYQAKAKVTDVLGASREQVFVVVAPGPLSQTSQSKPTGSVAVENTKKDHSYYWYIFGGLLLLVAGIMIGILTDRRRLQLIGKKHKKRTKK